MGRTGKRIECRVSDELHDTAERLALDRGFKKADGSPNVSQLLRALVEEEAARGSYGSYRKDIKD